MEVSTAFGDRSITKLRDLLSSGDLPTGEAQLALNLLCNQLHSSEKCSLAVKNSMLEICLLMIKASSVDSLVRIRSAKVISGLVKVSEGSDRLAERSKEGDGVFVLAEVCSKDEDLEVRRACVNALLSYCEWGGRDALFVLASAPSALEDVAEAVLGGCGESAVRVLAAASSTHEGCLAALGCPSMLPNLSIFLSGEASSLTASLEAPPPAPPFVPPPPHSQPPALPTLRALRALCTPDRGKTAALSAGAVHPISVHLAHPHPHVRSAAAECLAVLGTFLPALQSFLDGPSGEGPGALASLLLPCLLDPETRMSAAPALRIVCASARGREAVVGCALSGGAEAMRLLGGALGGTKLSGDLLDIVKTPLSDATMKSIALEGLLEIASSPSGLESVLSVPGCVNTLMGVETPEAKKLLEIITVK